MGNLVEQNLLAASKAGDFGLFKETLSELSDGELRAIKALPDILSNISRLRDSDISEDMTRLLMSRGEGFTDSVIIGRAMVQFAEHDKFGALDGVTDSLTPEQKASGELSSAAGEALKALANSEAGQELVTAATQDLVYKLGDQVSGDVIGQLMLKFAQNNDYDSLNVIADHLTSSQKLDISLSDYSENIFSAIVSNGFFNKGSVDTGYAISDLMDKLNWKSAEENAIRDKIKLAGVNDAVAVAGLPDADTILLTEYNVPPSRGNMGWEDGRGEGSSLQSEGLATLAMVKTAAINISGILESSDATDQAISSFIARSPVTVAVNTVGDEARMSFIDIVKMENFSDQYADATSKNGNLVV